MNGITTNIIIIAITCVISMLAFGNAEMIGKLILWPPAISRDRQYYRLITYGLIHADVQHLLFNMITLYFFGNVMERFYDERMGDFGYAMFYVSGLLVSILPTYFDNRDNPQYRSLGASGAVSAALFASILLQPWMTLYVFFFPMPAIVYAVLYLAYSVYMDRRGAGNINHSAHLWGAAYGVALTMVIEPAVISRFLDSLVHPSFHLR
jgi:membrane associated rhomboid family serine protease